MCHIHLSGARACAQTCTRTSSQRTATISYTHTHTHVGRLLGLSAGRRVHPLERRKHARARAHARPELYMAIFRNFILCDRINGGCARPRARNIIDNACAAAAGQPGTVRAPIRRSWAACLRASSSVAATLRRAQPRLFFFCVLVCV